MMVIRHRVNTISELTETPHHLGVEIDIRSGEQGLYLAHDPFVSGCSLDEFLDHFSHTFIVANVKEEGLEDRCEELFEKHEVPKFFFLDQSMPFLIRRGFNFVRNGAARISEFESIETVRKISEFCEWVWMDFFFKPQVSEDLFEEIRQIGLKICIVSPELHGWEREAEASELLRNVRALRLEPDAVCTKLVELWGNA